MTIEKNYLEAINKCKVEIKWAEDCIKEMELPKNPHNYTEEDKAYFPCWADAHREILEILIKRDR